MNKNMMWSAMAVVLASLASGCGGPNIRVSSQEEADALDLDIEYGIVGVDHVNDFSHLSNVRAESLQLDHTEADPIVFDGRLSVGEFRINWDLDIDEARIKGKRIDAFFQGNVRDAQLTLEELPCWFDFGTSDDEQVLTLTRTGNGALACEAPHFQPLPPGPVTMTCTNFCWDAAPDIDVHEGDTVAGLDFAGCRC